MVKFFYSLSFATFGGRGGVPIFLLISFALTALKYNSHTTESTHLKYAIIFFLCPGFLNDVEAFICVTFSIKQKKVLETTERYFPSKLLFQQSILI